LRAVLDLAELYALEAITAALELARTYNTYSHRFIRGLLEAGDVTSTPRAFLTRLIDQEIAAKTDRSINTRIGKARFPMVRRLEAFDFAFQPSLSPSRIRELAELGFLTKFGDSRSPPPPQPRLLDRGSRLPQEGQGCSRS